MGRKEDWKGRDRRKPSERETGIGTETEAEREEVEREIRVQRWTEGEKKDGWMGKEQERRRELDSYSEEHHEDRQNRVGKCG